MSKKTKTPSPAVRRDRAIKHFGGSKELAAFLGITHEAVIMWNSKNRKYLPELRAYRVLAEFPSLEETSATA